MAKSLGAEPSAAVKALAEFGADLTQAFRSDVTRLLGPGIQSIGTQVLLDPSRSLDPARAADVKEANAMLNLEFLKPEIKFDAAALLAAGRIRADQLAVADRIVEVKV